MSSLPVGYSPNPLKTLEGLFKNTYFLVPDYQRGYSWEKDQLVDLMEDIEKIINSSHKHYTGTVVLTPSRVLNDTFEIVDGQQRLTSLVILLKTIIDLDPKKYAELFSLYIQRGEVGNLRTVLQLNEETKNFFEDYIVRNKKISYEIKSHECIANAKEFFINEWLKEKPDLDRIIKIVTTQLGFMLYTPDNDKEIGIMFEVINNRGKNLSQLEKIKNYFIYFSTVNDREGLRELINRKWADIQKNLSMANKTSNEDEDSFLRNCYIVFFDINKEKSWYVYQQLKIVFNTSNKDKVYIDQSVERIEAFVEFLSNASLNYAYLYNAEGFFHNNYKGSNRHELDSALKYLRCQHTSASIMPLYLAIMSRLTSENETQRIVELLVLLEKVNFRIYILPKVTSRADSKQGDMFWFANHFYHNHDWFGEFETRYNNIKASGDIYDWVKEQLIQIAIKHCSVRKFVTSLTIDSDEAENYYHWNGMRYLLGNYEVALQLEQKRTWNIENILTKRKDGLTNDYLSREHIWAQSHRPEDFKADYIEKRRLGNFVLLGLASNIQLGKDDISAKIAELFELNEKIAGQMNLIQVFELKKIHEEALRWTSKHRNSDRKTKFWYANLSCRINDIRETKLISFALTRWQLPGDDVNRFVKVDSFMNFDKNEKFILKEKQTKSNDR